MPAHPGILALSALLLVACDRDPGQTAATSAKDDKSADQDAPATAMFTRADVASCAGFTVDSAAAILEVTPDALAAKTGWSEEMGGQMCRYWSSDSFIGPGIQFLFDVKDSDADAIASVNSLRRNAPAGSAAIGKVMGQSSAEAPLVELEGAGDEAIWDALTGGVTLRVGNIIASIEVAASGELAKGQDRDEIELERAVAAEIARGLVSPLAGPVPPATHREDQRP